MATREPSKLEDWRRRNPNVNGKGDSLELVNPVAVDCHIRRYADHVSADLAKSARNAKLG
jgi:hypothetical protein